MNTGSEKDKTKTVEDGIQESTGVQAKYPAKSLEPKSEVGMSSEKPKNSFLCAYGNCKVEGDLPFIITAKGTFKKRERFCTAVPENTTGTTECAGSVGLIECNEVNPFISTEDYENFIKQINQTRIEDRIVCWQYTFTVKESNESMNVNRTGLSDIRRYVQGSVWNEIMDEVPVFQPVSSVVK